MNLTRLNDIPQSKQAVKKLTPAHYPFPVFALCPPVYADNSIKNNPTMKEHDGEKIDRNKFLAQWYNLYSVLSPNALIYLITPVKGLQDETYVNSFAYLPHIKDKDVIVLSNFTAPGRSGEEKVAGGLLESLGYETVQCPFKFEGEPELKWLKDNIYIGGYGFRTDIQAHKWIEQKFGAKIISVHEQDPILYHLDCSVFIFDRHNVMLCPQAMDKESVRQIERIANVIPISLEDAYAGAANSLLVDDALYNSSPLAFMKENDPDYNTMRHKDQSLERICRDLGKEIIFLDLREAERSGAKLSCFCAHLNFSGR